MTSRRTRIATCAVTLLAGSTMSAAASFASTPPKPGTTYDTTETTSVDKQTQVTQDKLDSAYDQIQKRGMSLDAAAFTSVVLDPMSDTLTIHRVGGATDAYNDLVPSGTKLTFSESQVTLAAKTTFTAALEPMVAPLRESGTLVSTWGQLEGDDRPFLVYYSGAAPDATLVRNLPAGISFVPHDSQYQ